MPSDDVVCCRLKALKVYGYVIMCMGKLYGRSSTVKEGDQKAEVLLAMSMLRKAAINSRSKVVGNEVTYCSVTKMRTFNVGYNVQCTSNKTL